MKTIFGNKNVYALKRQQAHSPGQSVAAPRESNIANPRALQGQKHKYTSKI